MHNTYSFTFFMIFSVFDFVLMQYLYAKKGN
jgi:hypothetical protein